MSAASLILFSAIGLAALTSCTGQTAFAGNIYWPSSNTAAPKPVAFFPLTEGAGQEVSTWPAGAYGGVAQNSISWDADDKFGSVARCNRDVHDTIYLDGVPYGHSGTFAINMWFKLNTTDPSGVLFGYMLSQTANSTRSNVSTTNVFHEDTIALFLPQAGHPAAGLLRAVVKDSTDLGDMQSFIDSDGTYNDNNPRSSLNGTTNVADGAWHMVTLTTHTDGTSGFQVYIDAKPAATLPPKGYDATAQTMDGLPYPDPVHIDGGNPIFADSGDFFLCGRSDEDPLRHFSGHLAHLGIYDTALDATSVEALFNAIPVVTSAVSWQEHDRALHAGGADMGVCTSSMGVFLPRSGVPTPAAYFPLANGYTASWPLSLTTASLSGVIWAVDNTFGTALDCAAAGNPHVSIPNLQLGSKGAFAINLWIQQSANPGVGFQYVMSTRAPNTGAITADSIFDPNEIHLYLPDAAHPAAGLARAIVKDDDDTFAGASSRVWLDSDNTLGSNDVRNTQRANFTDGQWHMVTLTTHAAGGQGYELYVDGNLRGSLQGDQSAFHVDGGDPIMLANAPLILCGRADLAADRHFAGKLSQFGVWDQALTQADVMALWEAVTGTAPTDLQPLAAAMQSAVTQPTAAPLEAYPASTEAFPSPSTESPPVDPSSPSPTEATKSPASPVDTASASQSPATDANASPAAVQASPSPSTDGAEIDPVPVPNTDASPKPATGGDNVATASTSVPTPPGTAKSGLGSGPIAGIVVSVLAVVVAATAVAVYIGKNRHAGFQKEQLNDEESHNVGDEGLPSVSQRASDKNRLFGGRDSSAHVNINASAL
ncbi:hypothetical protein WJX72_000491 [[Myrmecia] bisecta]|uniref:Uncharacterized protein n=1 Tax=[Myrmecia] bisecta TaxID=41462 RepID=A0AAW1Q0N4_9CHLO